jgi:signal recognition particle receptor subunit beta
MVLFNYSTKELTAKVVYYGAGLCGKTTNLQWIHEKLPIKNKGKMLSLATETDRTLFFDFLPIEIGTIRGMRTRIQLYTVPGQVFYNATRRMVLKGADCVVFVCDSQEAVVEANLESFENLRENLRANEIDPDEVPIVLQYNKRDLPNALPIEILNERLNPRNYPFFEAVAVKGIGVEDTLKGVTKMVFKSLSARYGEPEKAGTNPGLAPPASNPPSSSPKAAAPARAPAPPRVAPTTPPVAARPSSAGAEDLLESYEAHHTDPVLEEVIEEEELPVAAPVRAKADPKGTLITSRSEAEDLRRRIATPGNDEFDVDLEEIDEEEGDIEELALESDPFPVTLDPPAAPPARAPRATPAPAPASSRPNPAPAPSRPSPAPAPSRPTPVPAARVPQAVATPSPSVVPVEVQVDVGPDEAEVQVPIEVDLPAGATRVTLKLRLVLNLGRGR